MKRLDQGHLHPLIKHPEATISRAGLEPGRLRHRQTLQQRATGIRTAYAVALLLFGTSTRLHQRMARKERM
jgi:hypothetical protein